MRRIYLPLVMSTAMVTATACGAQQSVDTTPTEAAISDPGPPKRLELGASTFLVAGEELRFALSLRGIVGGETVTVFGSPGTLGGRHVMIVRSRTETVGLAAAFKEVRDEVTTHIDLGSGVPVFQSADIKFGEKEAMVETRFGRGPFAIRYHRAGRNPAVFVQKLPDGQSAYDAHAALGAIRAWRPALPGSKAYFYALSGKRLWHNLVTAKGVETIKTRMGTFQAFRIEGTAWRMTRDLKLDRSKKPRHFTIFVSEDGDRKPLMVRAETEYGTVRVELVGYRRPDVRLTAR